jgi:hypothetical protein
MILKHFLIFQKPKLKLDPKKNMLSVLNSLEDLFKEAVSEAFPDLTDAPCPITPASIKSKFGDYQFNGAMAISGILKGIYFYFSYTF